MVSSCSSCCSSFEFLDQLLEILHLVDEPVVPHLELIDLLDGLLELVLDLVVLGVVLKLLSIF